MILVASQLFTILIDNFEEIISLLHCWSSIHWPPFLLSWAWHRKRLKGNRRQLPMLQRWPLLMLLLTKMQVDIDSCRLRHNCIQYCTLCTLLVYICSCINQNPRPCYTGPNTVLLHLDLHTCNHKFFHQKVGDLNTVLAHTHSYKLYEPQAPDSRTSPATLLFLAQWPHTSQEYLCSLCLLKYTFYNYHLDYNKFQRI